MLAPMEQRMKRIGLALAALAIAAAVGAFVGCDDDDDGWGDVGQPCDTAAECYPGVDHAEIEGDIVCLDRVEGGYCTHTCDDDGDCCAVDGECDYAGDLEQVCGPFESTDDKYCFLSCEGEENGDAFCQEHVHHDFICRSTGGGADNRKVCVPNG